MKLLFPELAMRQNKLGRLSQFRGLLARPLFEISTPNLDGNDPV
jgi:hypothetical protein